MNYSQRADNPSLFRKLFERLRERLCKLTDVKRPSYFTECGWILFDYRSRDISLRLSFSC